MSFQALYNLDECVESIKSRSKATATAVKSSRTLRQVEERSASKVSKLYSGFSLLPNVNFPGLPQTQLINVFAQKIIMQAFPKLRTGAIRGNGTNHQS